MLFYDISLAAFADPGPGLTKVSPARNSVGVVRICKK